MKRIIFMTCLILLATSFNTMAVEIADVGGLTPDVPNFVGYAPNRIVVKFDPPTIQAMDKGAMAHGKTGVPALDVVGTSYGVRSLRPQFPGAKKKTYKGKVIDLSGWYEIIFPGRTDIIAAVEHYKAIQGVMDAQPIGIHKVNIEPNDWNYIYEPYQWHLPRIQAPQAWDFETGNPDIIVAVMDTGVRYFHQDLGGANASFSNPTAAEGNMWINVAEKNGIEGVDDDENGYIDDWIGWDFVHVLDNYPLMQCFPGEDCLDPDNDPRDFQGHGTHCAGNVATMNNNSYSQASVTGGWGDGTFVGGSGTGVKVMDLRIGWRAIYGILFDVGLVDMGFAAQAMYYAAEKGAKIVSGSWGSDASGGIDEAIDYYLASGGLVFKAAGNDSTETADHLCARDDVLCVAATDQNDCKASFSTYGTWVDISAPGVGIWSSWHNADDPINDYIATMDGTSMATPLAASVAALIWSQNPTWTAAQVRQQLFDSADPIDTLGCNIPYSGKLGAGRINAYRAVSTETPTPPQADFTASPTSGEAPLTVTFTDQSTGSINSWSWTFGDGGSSSAQSPSHTYTDAGTYTVSLTVTGQEGSHTNTKTNLINVSSSSSPVADFSASPLSGVANPTLRVTFSNLSTGNIISQSWDFGDGGVSTDREPWHDYYPGSYTVSLSVTGQGGGTDVETKMDYINVTEQYEAGVASLESGYYSGRGKNKSFQAGTQFSQGDEVVIQAQIDDSNGAHVAGAVVELYIDGPSSVSLTTGPSNSDGIAEAKWNTSAPKGKKGTGGTPTGDYTVSVNNVTVSGYVWDLVAVTYGFNIQ